MLHCKHKNERLEFGMETLSIVSHSFIRKKSLMVPCRTIIVDLGLSDIDPGLTPNGAKCGNDKVSFKKNSLGRCRLDCIFLSLY